MTFLFYGVSSQDDGHRLYVAWNVDRWRMRHGVLVLPTRPNRCPDSLVSPRNGIAENDSRCDNRSNLAPQRSRIEWPHRAVPALAKSGLELGLGY
jgi:hypothetical protein